MPESGSLVGEGKPVGTHSRPWKVHGEREGVSLSVFQWWPPSHPHPQDIFFAQSKDPEKLNHFSRAQILVSLSYVQMGFIFIYASCLVSSDLALIHSPHLNWYHHLETVIWFCLPKWNLSVPSSALKMKTQIFSTDLCSLTPGHFLVLCPSHVGFLQVPWK